MNAAITNEDVFDEFLEVCKTANKKDILKLYGGSSIYVPSYKTTNRNDDIKSEFALLITQNTSKNIILRTLSNKFNLSVNRIQEIIKQSA